MPLASAGDSKRPFKVPSAGYQIYDAPTGASAGGELAPGDTVQATSFTAGWALSDEGWIREPAIKIDDGNESSETWAKVKEKTGAAWDATKEKSKNLTAAAKEKASETKQSSRTLTFPAMVSSSILSVIAAILAIAALVVRRAHGLALTTPSGIARTATAFVTAPAALIISLFAAATAPFAWTWPPILAGASGLLSVAALYVFAARLRGGHAHESQEALIAGLRSPVAIGAGLATAAATIGVTAIAGLAWPAYVVAALGSIVAYAGIALTAKHPPENTDTEAEQTDTPDGEIVEAPAEAEPEMAE